MVECFIGYNTIFRINNETTFYKMKYTLALIAALFAGADARQRRCFSNKCKDSNPRYAECEFYRSRSDAHPRVRERVDGIAIAK